MCGICGVWNYKNCDPVNRDLLKSMTDRMIHRGPDDRGLYFDDAAGIGLGFRRLAIIDLSPAARQPMSNEDGSVWLVFNGEIYNFLTLRPKLEKRGHSFRSNSDSEVIIHNYEERGSDIFNDLNGMFGLAIWDAPKRRLVMARDRLGKKPLYYYRDSNRLIFASELKAILADPFVPREINETALAEYLALGYVSAPQTIFTGINKVSPGHSLIFEGERIEVRRYWDWLPAFQVKAVRSEGEYIEELRALLKTIVAERLISDVPLGAFLSGGVDSSAVVAVMAGLSSQPVKTFSIGFKQDAFNELPYARLVAERFGTEHYEYIVEPEELRDLVPNLVRQFDEPFADSSAVPTYYVAKMASQEVTVCLSGDGGDEAMAGYPRYSKAIREGIVYRLPLELRRVLFGLPAQFLPVGFKGEHMLQRFALAQAERYPFAMRQVSKKLLAFLLAPDTAYQFNLLQSPSSTACVEQALERAGNLDFLSRLQYTDGVTYLPDDILVKVDRTSMTNSLEVRAPLLDYRFMEFMAGLSPDLRWRDGKGKYIFKKAIRNLLPNEILFRKKMGFGIPLQDWFSHELKGYASEILLDHQTLQRGLWNPEKVKILLNKAQNRNAYALQNAIWVMLMLEMWWRAYLGNNRTT